MIINHLIEIRSDFVNNTIIDGFYNILFQVTVL